MHAIRLHAPGDLRLSETAPPTSGPGEVLIRVEAAGICGTDRHLFQGEFPCTPPVTLGHEFSGIITATGPSVSLPVGLRVTCDPNDPCLECEPCQRGRVNLCERNSITGITRDGGFAPFVSFPARKAIALPASLHPHHGAFCEPLACTLHGLDLAAVMPGHRVTILGGGVIGLLALQLARNAGAETLLITRHPAVRGGSGHRHPCPPRRGAGAGDPGPTCAMTARAFQEVETCGPAAKDLCSQTATSTRIAEPARLSASSVVHDPTAAATPHSASQIQCDSGKFRLEARLKSPLPTRNNASPPIAEADSAHVPTSPGCTIARSEPTATNTTPATIGMCM